MFRHVLAGAGTAIAVACGALVARAQAVPQASVPPTAVPPMAPQPQPPPSPSPSGEKLKWRDTWLIWDNTVTAQTLGIGRGFQSSNPYYEMSASLRPRYYLYEGEKDGVYAAGRIDLVHEFTNSDTTTDQGETTASDATLLTAYRRTLASRGAYETTLVVRSPILTVPTSKFSFGSGTILGLGSEVRLVQSVPLAGDRWPIFKKLTLAAFVGYNHTFTRAVVPVNGNLASTSDLALRRVRADPEGRTLPGDELTGVAFPKHEVNLTARLMTQITERLLVFLELEYRPTWKYPFGSASENITTGSTPVTPLLNPTTYVPVTRFETDVFYDVLDELGVGVAYSNEALAVAPDGQRRSILTSPGAQLSLELVLYVDAAYLAAMGRHEAASSGGHLHP